MQMRAMTRPGATGQMHAPTGLARAAIESALFARDENQKIWAEGWACVGSEAVIPRVGDLLPFTLGDQGIHVEHVADEKFVARFNKAPHGGCRVVPLQCQTGTKTKCAFSSCGHSRDRGPMRVEDEIASHQYLGLRPERLLRVPLHRAHGLLFVNLGAEIPFFLPPLPAVFSGPARAEDWREYGFNWKEFLLRLAGSGTAVAARNWLASARARCAEKFVVRWMFPNLLLLGEEKSGCAIVAQPTALGMTLARVSSFGGAKDWHGVIGDLLRDEPDAASDAAAFLRATLVRKLEPDDAG